MKVHPFHPNPIPPVGITIDNENDYNHYNHFTWDVRCQFFWWKYKAVIFVLLFLILCGIISVMIVFNSNKSSPESTSTNPCSTYKMDDLANSISMNCFQTLWKNVGCIEKGKGTVPSDYKGWWLRSPEGGKTVFCIYPNVNERCGAGNYGTIVNNLWICDLNYKGYNT